MVGVEKGVGLKGKGYIKKGGQREWAGVKVHGITPMVGIGAGQVPPPGVIAAAVSLMSPTPATASGLRRSAPPITASKGTTLAMSSAALTPESPVTALWQEESQQLETAVVVSPNVPPIPRKMAEKIWRKGFVELDALLPARLGVPEPDLGFRGEEERKKKRGITTIQEWICCFNTFSGVVLLKDPGRAGDLLAYSSLIVKASADYVGSAWLGYDRLFRRQAAAAEPVSQFILSPPFFVPRDTFH